MHSENNIVCKAVTPDLWSDLELLFGKSGAYWVAGVCTGVALIKNFNK